MPFTMPYCPGQPSAQFAFVQEAMGKCANAFGRMPLGVHLLFRLRPPWLHSAEPSPGNPLSHERGPDRQSQFQSRRLFSFCVLSGLVWAVWVFWVRPPWLHSAEPSPGNPLSHERGPDRQGQFQSRRLFSFCVLSGYSGFTGLEGNAFPAGLSGYSGLAFLLWAFCLKADLLAGYSGLAFLFWAFWVFWA